MIFRNLEKEVSFNLSNWRKVNYICADARSDVSEMQMEKEIFDM